MEYEDLFKMINDILSYVGEHPGRVIICDDNPLELTMGFTLRDVDPFILNKPSWYIKIKNYKASVNKEEVPLKVREYLRELFRTVGGRQALAEFLTRGRKPIELE
jgi:hypothetical protein